jgi:hypothetical protein
LLATRQRIGKVQETTGAILITVRMDVEINPLSHSRRGRSEIDVDGRHATAGEVLDQLPDAGNAERSVKYENGVRGDIDVGLL